MTGSAGLLKSAEIRARWCQSWVSAAWQPVRFSFLPVPNTFRLLAVIADPGGVQSHSVSLDRLAFPSDRRARQYGPLRSCRR